MQNNFITKLLDLKGVKVTKFRKGKPIDIIKCRHKVHLFSYFNKFSLEERKKG